MADQVPGNQEKILANPESILAKRWSARRDRVGRAGCA